MGNRFENAAHFFNFMEHHRFKTNEYYLDGKKLGAPVPRIPSAHFNLLEQEGLVEKTIRLGSKHFMMIVVDEAVRRFHPNTIDNKEFWEFSKDVFPLLSVCSQPSKSMKEANKHTLSLPVNFKFLDHIRDLINVSDEPLNFLEIGFGYGNIFDLLKDATIYKGIDYTIPPSMRRHSELIEIDKSGIPKNLNLKNHYDIIYSCNVLQHCSQKDRFAYFKQASRALKIGGHLMFSCNVYADDNKHMKELWGCKDKQGRYYTQFFSQLTEVDTEEELLNRLLALGFHLVSIKKHANCWGIIAQKT